MQIIMIFLALGIVLGATVFPKKHLKKNNRVQIFGIVLVLFSMGVSIGASPTLLDDLKNSGVNAAVFSVATVIGSIVVVYALSKLFFKPKQEDEK